MTVHAPPSAWGGDEDEALSLRHFGELAVGELFLGRSVEAVDVEEQKHSFATRVAVGDSQQVLPLHTIDVDCPKLLTGSGLGVERHSHGVVQRDDDGFEIRRSGLGVRNVFERGPPRAARIVEGVVAPLEARHLDERDAARGLLVAGQDDVDVVVEIFVVALVERGLDALGLPEVREAEDPQGPAANGVRFAYVLDENRAAVLHGGVKSEKALEVVGHHTGHAVGRDPARRQCANHKSASSP